MSNRPTMQAVFYPDMKSAASGLGQLQITSPAFGHMQPIPRQYTCDGADINPQLDIGHIPSGARSIAIIMTDDDHGLSSRVHWVAWNIPIVGSIREARTMEIQGTNDFHQSIYRGPCPQYGTHRYFFKVYALDMMLDLPALSTAFQLEKAMEGHILGYGELAGIYRRK